MERAGLVVPDTAVDTCRKEHVRYQEYVVSSGTGGTATSHHGTFCNRCGHWCWLHPIYNEVLTP